MNPIRFTVLCTVLSFLSLSVKAQQESAQTQLSSSKKMVVITAPTPSPTPRKTSQTTITVYAGITRGNHVQAVIYPFSGLLLRAQFGHLEHFSV